MTPGNDEEELRRRYEERVTDLRALADNWLKVTQTSVVATFLGAAFKGGDLLVDIDDQSRRHTATVFLLAGMILLLVSLGLMAIAAYGPLISSEVIYAEPFYSRERRRRADQSARNAKAGATVLVVAMGLILGAMGYSWISVDGRAGDDLLPNPGASTNNDGATSPPIDPIGPTIIDSGCGCVDE